MSPIEFSLMIDDFDVNRLPMDAELLKSDRSLLERAIEEHYESAFRDLGGEAEIVISDGLIRIRWRPESGQSGLVSGAVTLLRQGEYDSAVPLLRTALQNNPDDGLVLYNLGMALSDLGEISDAIVLLSRLTEIEPENSRAWNALGVAYERMDEADKAEAALRESVRLDPDDGYAHRNLGGILGRRLPEEAVKHFERAYELQPDDQQTAYGYGLALHHLDRQELSGEILQKAIDIAPLTDIAEKARNLMRGMASKSKHDSAAGSYRPDVMMYCLGALQYFDAHPDKVQEVSFEIAMLGRQGLDMDDPTAKYTLRSMEGEFTGLRLVAYMYVGFKKLAPELDTGADFSAEYRDALTLFQKKRGDGPE